MIPLTKSSTEADSRAFTKGRGSLRKSECLAEEGSRRFLNSESLLLPFSSLLREPLAEETGDVTKEHKQELIGVRLC